MVNLISTAADKLLFGICTMVDHVFYGGEIRTRYRAPARRDKWRSFDPFSACSSTGVKFASSADTGVIKPNKLPFRPLTKVNAPTMKSMEEITREAMKANEIYFYYYDRRRHQ